MTKPPPTGARTEYLFDFRCTRCDRPASSLVSCHGCTALVCDACLTDASCLDCAAEAERRAAFVAGQQRALTDHLIGLLLSGARVGAEPLPRLSDRPRREDESPSYRAAMRDAGRSRLLR